MLKWILLSGFYSISNFRSSLVNVTGQMFPSKTFPTWSEVHFHRKNLVCTSRCICETDNCTYTHSVFSWRRQALMMRLFISLNIQNLASNLGAFSMLSLINEKSNSFILSYQNLHKLAWRQWNFKIEVVTSALFESYVETLPKSRGAHTQWWSVNHPKILPDSSWSWPIVCVWWVCGLFFFLWMCF